MMSDNSTMNAEFEPVPVEGPKTEIMRLVSEGDPETQIAILEKKAALAPRFRQAIETILISQTYPADWSIQGEGDKARACLGSAGAERVGRNFPIRYYDVHWHKEEFSDDHGEAYRYTFTGYASLADRVVHAEGIYSTRDKFLGFANKEWRAPEDINEANIRRAAHHIFTGNAIKELLGLRNFPASEYYRIMGKTGQNSAASTKVERAQGTQGGSSEDEHAKQKELAEICVAVANAGYTVERNDKGYWEPVPKGAGDPDDELELAKAVCVKLSSFKGKEGEVPGKTARELNGKRLDATLGTARKVKESLDREHSHE